MMTTLGTKMITIDGISTFEESIKHSRFISRASRTDTIDEALLFLETSRKIDATHNCWAYKIGEIYRFSDNGEPGGTAGRPIYIAIENSGMDHIMVIVTRYFGGIKLGAGGLARAYGGSASKCLQLATRYVVQQRVIFHLEVPFSLTGIAYQLLDNNPDIEKLNEEFLETGIRFTLRMTDEKFFEFESVVRDASRNNIRLIVHHKIYK